MSNTLPSEIVEAVDGALEAAGLVHYDAAVIVIRIPHAGGGRVLRAHMGAPDVLRQLLEEEMKRLEPGIITMSGRTN